ncbi:permease for cytosine/purines, uracil, thiamine, allantoin-domain-containing protein [Ilyonectria destructans]|nr:permease for cytosine/purines, uracil, thiamine, allantoin-domain-containing protein [Ilyonectria destructans]
MLSLQEARALFQSRATFLNFVRSPEAPQAFGTAGWNVAASLIAIGLTWQQAFISCVLGSFIIAVVVIGMVRAGARYHIGYPVLTFYGANLLSTCLRCIFGSHWENLANTLPESVHVSSKTLLCFFLVWLLQLPLCFIHPTKIHILFTLKGILVPVATFGIFGWCMDHGTGLSNIDDQSAAGSENAAKVPLGWAVMGGVNTILGTLSPMLVNQPDLSRYCKKPRDVGILQGVSVFVAKVLVMFLGLASTSSMQGAWGETYWNFWDLNEAILDRNWNAKGRAGVFLVSLTYLYSVFGMNIGSNSIPFGADMTDLLPRYLTIRRGQILRAMLSVCFVPWELIATAQKFITFLGSDNIFMAPLCAIIIADYVVVRKGNIHVPSLYNGHPGGLYWFTGGVHIPTIIAWCFGVAIGLPGLVGSYEPTAVNQAAKNTYKLGWLLYASTAAVVYLVCMQIWKPAVHPRDYEGTPFTWEYMAKGQRDGFFDDEVSGDSVTEGVEATQQVRIVQESADKKV